MIYVCMAIHNSKDIHTLIDVLWLFMELQECYRYMERHNSIMEQHKSVFMDFHIDLHKLNYGSP